MATSINDIKMRLQAIKKETQEDSVSPERLGEVLLDLLELKSASTPQPPFHIGKTGYNPVEDWQDLITGIYELIRNMPSGDEVPSHFYTVIGFLLNTLPDWEQAKKMAE
jgi:hypothetical protein